MKPGEGTVAARPPVRRRWRGLLMATALVLAACGGGGRDAGLDRAAPPTTAASTTTTAALATTTSTATPPAAASGATCPPIPARPQPPADRPVYRLDLDVDPAARRASGGVTVTFTPDLPVDRLVFRLWPNGPRPARGGASLATGPVTLDGRPAESRQPEPTILEVPIPGGLAAGERVTAAVPFELRLPGAINDRVAAGDDWARLGSFYPILEWQPGVGWNTVPPTGGFAEASVAPTADFTLRVTVPDGLQVLASGTQEPDGTWRSVAARDIALTVGRLSFVSGTAAAPEPVEVVVGAHAGTNIDPALFRDKAIRVLEDFAARYGPYPWPRYTLGITPLLSGGIEYPGHVLQGPPTLGRTTSHEIGHMWFYGLVGNHQGLHPWLDEGITSWAEARYEGTVEEFRSTSVPGAARGRVGEPMTYWERRQGSYYRGVYVQGAQALAALGDPDLVDCALRHYVARNAYRVATPADLLDALDDVFPDARAVLNRYGAGV